MTWADDHIVERGVEWRVQHAQNDQLGKGDIVGAARNPDLVLCPAAALAEWRAACAQLLLRRGRRRYRVLYRRSERLVVLLHAFAKRSAKIPEREIHIARDRWDDFKARMEADPRVPLALQAETHPEPRLAEVLTSDV